MRGLILSIVVFSSILINNAMAQEVANGYKIGDKATDFKLKSVDEKFYSLADYKDAKGFIVI